MSVNLPAIIMAMDGFLRRQTDAIVAHVTCCNRGTIHRCCNKVRLPRGGETSPLIWKIIDRRLHQK